jgi:hypothetical protein
MCIDLRDSRSRPLAAVHFRELDRSSWRWRINWRIQPERPANNPFLDEPLVRR